ncbi:LysR family glycine cleavage system transcriptional activator [Buttiauxella sp. BIGb0471]|uniref:LysR substrate-binding domain-containing protein n=1 Tax=Buttiauxella sp. BIGb0471 TaxID=2940597 RepID=UPI0021674F27|nr:LysR substrate-binding domain-containing protein [Buttiauxella sp. BIGb0471]MCS3602067.1 LysR family glycine cleavage system transcriptional activator [Buttiauxella sp. BIGb0471]
MRRNFPLNTVDAFLVTAKHLNLTRAAKELCLTQGAVSRKISTLEEWLGFSLFDRHARGLHLTPQGSALLPELQQAFEHLLNVASDAAHKPSIIRLKAPTCAMRWLVPKLVQLESVSPDIQVALTTTVEHGVNFNNEPFDAAITFGKPSASGTLLFEERLTPVISQHLMPENALTPEDLSRYTFLHPTRDRIDWSLWFAQNVAHPPVMTKNQHFDTMDLAISAAIQGFGIAIADATLVAEDLHRGRLVQPFAGSVKTGACYCLALRPGDEGHAGLEEFKRALLAVS